MSDLYNLFKLRGVKISQIARTMGVGYHSLQKTAKGTYKTPATRKILAAYFGVDAKLLFGKRRAATIRYLMEREIEKQGEKLQRELRARYLGDKRAA